MESKRVLKINAASLAKYFVWADVFTFIVQAVGGTMVSPGSSATVVDVGLKVYMVGIGLQELFILLFLALMIRFHVRMNTMDKTMISIREVSWRPLQWALYSVLLAITVRIIYRIAEYAGGIKPSNPIPFHEAYSYALDAFPMMVALLVLAIWHPGRTLKGPGSEFPHLSRKEKKQMKKDKKMRKKGLGGEALNVAHPSPGDVQMDERLYDAVPASGEQSTERLYGVVPGRITEESLDDVEIHGPVQEVAYGGQGSYGEYQPVSPVESRQDHAFDGFDGEYRPGQLPGFEYQGQQSGIVRDLEQPPRYQRAESYMRDV